MIDHAAARQALATSLDFDLPAPDVAALDEHLGACTACRSETAALRADATALRRLGTGPVPISVRANLAIAAEHATRAPAGRWVALAAVGALLAVVLGGGALGVGGQRGGSTDGDQAAAGAPPQVAWQTAAAGLSATSFRIEAGGRAFLGDPAAHVSSDPGDATYRTLEVTWQEHGVEMRLNLYFGGDERSWWVSEIRAYDGRAVPKADWMSATGKWFQSPIGQAWTGDIDVPLKGQRTGIGGKLHLAGATVATRAVDSVTEPFGGGRAVGELEKPFDPGGELRCSGILQMAPADAEAALLSLGYRLSWRRDVTTGPITGYAEAMPHAPDGVITGEPVGGSSGELIVFVSPFGDRRAIPIPYPADCPAADPGGPVLAPVPTQGPATP